VLASVPIFTYYYTGSHVSQKPQYKPSPSAAVLLFDFSVLGIICRRGKIVSEVLPVQIQQQLSSVRIQNFCETSLNFFDYHGETP